MLCSVLTYALAQDGYRLALLGRNEEKLERLAEDIRRKGGTVNAYRTDVTLPEEVRSAHQQILKQMGPCEILINGAGGNHPSGTTEQEMFLPDASGTNFFDLSSDGLEHVFRLNLYGTILPCQIFAKDMAAQKKGCIVNFSSMAAFSPLTRTPAYCAAKSGVSNFTQWLAVHLAARGIRVNALAPGFFLTGQNQSLLQNPDGTLTPRATKIVSRTPLNRFGQPEDLVGALRFLLDDKASAFLTGVILPVDGGFSAYSGV